MGITVKFILLGKNFTSVVFGCLSNNFLKHLCEIVYIGNSAVLCNGLNLEIGCVQKKDRMVDSFAFYIFCQGESGFLLKKCGQVAGIDIQALGLGVQTQIPRQVCGNLRHNLLYNRGVTLQGMALNQMAVFADNIFLQSQRISGTGQLHNSFQRMGGKVFNMNRRYVGRFCSFAQ